MIVHRHDDDAPPIRLQTLRITSSAFAHERPIPKRHTADGENLSPPLEWSGVPPDAGALALIVDDPDAPSPQPFVHWVLINVPAGVASLPEGIRAGEQPFEVPGALQGRNDFSGIGYGGPAPPKGHGAHRYRFRLYALAGPIEGLDPAPTKPRALEAMRDRILAWGELVGTYQRRDGQKREGRRR